MNPATRLNEVAAGITGRAQTRVEVALAKVRDKVDLYQLMLLIADGQARNRAGQPFAKQVDKGLDELLPDAALRDGLQPVITILRDAFGRGGRLAAEDINAAR